MVSSEAKRIFIDTSKEIAKKSEKKAKEKRSSGNEFREYNNFLRLKGKVKLYKNL